MAVKYGQKFLSVGITVWHHLAKLRDVDFYSYLTAVKDTLICLHRRFIMSLQIFDLDCHDAVNCCYFLSDVCVVCGTQDGHITLADVRNIRYILLPSQHY